MPFAGVCKKCKYLLIGENKNKIALKIGSHFARSHKTSPKPLPYFLDMSDFKPNLVTLSSGRPFTSRLFCSEDYCLAVITGNDYRDCLQDESQKHLSIWLSEYFPREVIEG